MNMRYREIDGDDGLSGEWQHIKERYWIQYSAEAPDPNVLDQLYVSVQGIERREPPVKLDVIKQAQADTNAHFYPQGLPDVQ
jgi:hypothetical protein